jgi:Zn finger protein HypA/HybF involved in hydrogenase expression
MADNTRQIQPVPEKEEDIQPVPLVFYCKNCEKIVAAVQTKKKFQFRCPACNKTDVAFGTDLSVKNFYRIKETE